MNIARWFQEKWINRIRQFGLRAALSQLIRAALRPIIQIEKFWIMAILDHQPDTRFKQHNISDMTSHAVVAAGEYGELNERQQKVLLGFLADNCLGFLIKVKNRLAGYAVIQPAGACVFGASGKLQIPEKMMLLKNLLVFSEFRGHSLGKKLNQARIASIPAEQTPISIVITENRFAIRNLKLYGFEKMLFLKRTTWLKRWTQQHIEIKNDCKITHRLIRGLIIESKNSIM